MIVYKGKLLKKSSNRKSKLVLSTLVTTWLSNIAFHLRPIWLQTLVAIDLESCQTLFPSFCAHLDLVLCSGFDLEHAVLFLRHISTQKPAKRWARLWSATTSCQLHRKNHFAWRKKRWLVVARNLQSIKSFLTLELSQYRKSGSTFSSSELVAARSDCLRLGNALPCVCARPSDPPKLCWSAPPRAQPLNLQSNPSIVSWNSFREWMPDVQGLELGLKLELLRLTNWL